MAGPQGQDDRGEKRTGQPLDGKVRRMPANIPIWTAMGAPIFETALYQGVKQLDFRDQTTTNTHKKQREGIASLRAHLVPHNLTRWTDFEDDIAAKECPEAVREETCHQSQFPTDRGYRFYYEEATGLDIFSGKVLFPMRPGSILQDFIPEFAENKVASRCEQMDVLGGRVDIAFYRDLLVAKEDAEGEAAPALAYDLQRLALSPEADGRYKFLLHEHKSANVFPVLEEGSGPTPDLVAFYSKAMAPEIRDRTHNMMLRRTTREQVSEDAFRKLEKCAGPIHQLFGCMFATGLKYGVLSTTEYTWFFRHDGAGELQVSRAYFGGEARADDESTNTLPIRRVYTRFVMHVLRDEEAVGFKVDPTSPLYAAIEKEGSEEPAEFFAGRYEGNGEPGQADETGDFKAFLDELVFKPQHEEYGILPLGISCHHVEEFGAGQYGYAVRMNTWGLDHVAKLVLWDDNSREYTNEDAIGSFDREAAAYKALEGLQGDVIPHCYYNGWCSFGRYGLVTSYEGKTLRELYGHDGPVPRDVATKAKRALEAVHAGGYLHGDVARRNVVVHPKTAAVKFIDLAHAGSLAKLDEAEQKRRKAMELEALATALGESSSASASTGARATVRRMSERLGRTKQ